MTEPDTEPKKIDRNNWVICPVPATRIHDQGDVHRSYSADLIAMQQKVRTPFRHDGHLWICVSISGSALTRSGYTELEAYRLTPRVGFKGVATTYRARSATAEAAEAARNDPFGFYHGIAVKHGSAAFVLTGPPVRFVPESAPARPPPATVEPAQLSLF